MVLPAADPATFLDRHGASHGPHLANVAAIAREVRNMPLTGLRLLARLKLRMCACKHTCLGAVSPVLAAQQEVIALVIYGMVSY